ncbi:MAG: RibD family protein [Chloroflexota bacterium]
MAVDSGQVLVTLKFAQTLDGRIATSSFHSRWISGQETQVYAHQLRAEHDAILVGVGTVVADNPLLTVRHSSGKNPRRVVIDSTLRTPIEASVLDKATGSAMFAVGEEAARTRGSIFEEAGAEIVVVPLLDGQIDLRIVLEALAYRNVHSVLVEGGARIITSILHAQLADRVVIITAPKIIGQGIEAVGNLDIDRIDDAITFENPSFEAVGQDVVFRGDVKRKTFRSHL